MTPLTAALARLEKGVPAETTFFDKIKDVASQVSAFFSSGSQTDVKPTAGASANMPTAPTQIDKTSIPTTGGRDYMTDDDISDLTGDYSDSKPTPGPKKADTPDNDTAALLAELVRLQAENNKLSKRQISATEEIDF